MFGIGSVRRTGGLGLNRVDGRLSELVLLRSRVLSACLDSRPLRRVAKSPRSENALFHSGRRSPLIVDLFCRLEGELGMIDGRAGAVEDRPLTGVLAGGGVRALRRVESSFRPNDGNLLENVGLLVVGGLLTPGEVTR